MGPFSTFNRASSSGQRPITAPAATFSLARLLFFFLSILFFPNHWIDLTHERLWGGDNPVMLPVWPHHSHLIIPLFKEKKKKKGKPG
jgi:hypothetical protein